MKQGKFQSNNEKMQDLWDDELMQDPVETNVTGSTRRAGKAKRRDSASEAQKGVLIYLHDLVYLLGTILVIFLVCFRVVVVSGSSMKGTLVDGDYLLLISSTFYREPQQGDIIVASKDSFENGEPIVKRVIATEGQEVFIDFHEGIVYVDGIELVESYTYTPTTLYEGVNFPVTVPDGCVFVMGDNRNDSRDSRNPEIGMVDTREIIGKAICLFLPGTDKGTTQRQFDRIGALN